jgi:hypothetical protein
VRAQEAEGGSLDKARLGLRGGGSLEKAWEAIVGSTISRSRANEYVRLWRCLDNIQ